MKTKIILLLLIFSTLAFSQGGSPKYWKSEVYEQCNLINRTLDQRISKSLENLYDFPLVSMEEKNGFSVYKFKLRDDKITGYLSSNKGIDSWRFFIDINNETILLNGEARTGISLINLQKLAFLAQKIEDEPEGDGYEKDDKEFMKTIAEK